MVSSYFNIAWHMSRYVLYIFPIQILDLLYVLVCPLWLIDSTKFKLHLHKVGNISMSSDISNCFEQELNWRRERYVMPTTMKKNQIEIRSQRFVAYNAREKKKWNYHFNFWVLGVVNIICNVPQIVYWWNLKHGAELFYKKSSWKCLKKILDMLFST